MNVLLAVGIALAGVLLGALLTGWTAYHWGRSDGKMAERTRRTAFELKRNRAQREREQRNRTPWVTEPPRPSPLDHLPATQLVPNLIGPLTPATSSSGWLIPAHSDWTGPQQRLDAAYSFDSDGQLIETVAVSDAL